MTSGMPVVDGAIALWRPSLIPARPPGVSGGSPGPCPVCEVVVVGTVVVGVVVVGVVVVGVVVVGVIAVVGDVRVGLTGLIGVTGVVGVVVVGLENTPASSDASVLGVNALAKSLRARYSLRGTS